MGDGRLLGRSQSVVWFNAGNFRHMAELFSSCLLAGHGPEEGKIGGSNFQVGDLLQFSFNCIPSVLELLEHTVSKVICVFVCCHLASIIFYHSYYIEDIYSFGT